MEEIDIRERSTASPEAVWRLLGDSSTWPSFSQIDSFELERPAGDDGLGEVRVFRTGRYTIREEIVERDEPRRLTYVLLSGLPLRNYRAEIDLTPDGDGTEIRWHTTFEPKIPLTGGAFRRGLGKTTQQFVDGLARAAAES